MLTQATSWKYETDVLRTDARRAEEMYRRTVLDAPRLDRVDGGGATFHADLSMRRGVVCGSRGGMFSDAQLEIDSLFRGGGETASVPSAAAAEVLHARSQAQPVHAHAPFQHFSHIVEPAFLLRDRENTRAPAFPLDDPVARGQRLVQHAHDERARHTVWDARDEYLREVVKGDRRRMGAVQRAIAPPMVFDTVGRDLSSLPRFG